MTPDSSNGTEHIELGVTWNDLMNKFRDLRLEAMRTTIPTPDFGGFVASMHHETAREVLMDMIEHHPAHFARPTENGYEVNNCLIIQRTTSIPVGEFRMELRLR